MIKLEFTAVAPVVQGWKSDIHVTKHKFYDCSFSIEFDETKVNTQDVNVMAQNSIHDMQRNHPNSKIIKQTQVRV